MAPAQGWHANSWSVPYFFAILGVTLRLNVVRCVSMAILAFLRCSVTVLQQKLCVYHYSVFGCTHTCRRSPPRKLPPTPLKITHNISCLVCCCLEILHHCYVPDEWLIINDVYCDSRKFISQACCVGIKNHILKGKEGRRKGKEWRKL